MNYAIQYYLHQLDKSNDLTGIAYINKLIQLEHQPTIDKTLDGLKNVQYPRHFPNHLVMQLARLNRPYINEELITYFKLHFKATNTEWHAISALQDERVVETVVNAIEQYQVSYFSRKVVNRCIRLLGQIGSYNAYEALRDIINDYFDTRNRFIDNYEVPLADEALDALAKINLPDACTYYQQAKAHYQARIAQELSIYPERLNKERTCIGIDLHEGSALDRMHYHALPTLIEWHQRHPSENIRNFARTRIIRCLQKVVKRNDPEIQTARQYLITLYDELKANKQLISSLRALDYTSDKSMLPFAVRIFQEDLATTEALQIFARQRASSVFSMIYERFNTLNDTYRKSHLNINLMKAYINYFGYITIPQAEATLVDLYHQQYPHLQLSIAEALVIHARESDTALDFLYYIIENNTDTYTIKQTLYLLPQIGERALLILLNSIDCNSQHCQYAVEALGLMRNKHATPHLIQALVNADGNDELQDAILKALERIGTEACFSALMAWENAI
ncbi:MAG: HEAT repeat domain-containing protein [Anaerolineae bacterium]